MLVLELEPAARLSSHTGRAKFGKIIIFLDSPAKMCYLSPGQVVHVMQVAGR